MWHLVAFFLAWYILTIMDNTTPLEINGYRKSIMTALAAQGCAIITAAPGTGKSTQVPLFFKERTGTVLVLQPRRIAARRLATYVSSTLGEQTGTTVGYRVRFDSCVGPQTKIIYQTYGVFVRQLLTDPLSTGVALVILDEYHERTLEVDLVLAWLKRLRTTHPHNAPAFMVMSATLQVASLVTYLAGVQHIHVHAQAYPVTVSYMPAQPREWLASHAVRALQEIFVQRVEGSILIFMPGVGEIKKTLELAAPLCREYGMACAELHGSLSLVQQSALLERAKNESLVIVSTNVAETSLTIPGVTVVIDSGKERRGAYDYTQDRNTLFVHTISMSSAVQRMGRAGRTVPGRCVRMWAPEQEVFMEEILPPEVFRLELSPLMLTAAGLQARTHEDVSEGGALAWPEKPPLKQWEHARTLLVQIGALLVQNAQTSITSAGLKMLTLPVRPCAAELLFAGQEHGVGLMAAAIIALWEADIRSKERGALNMFTRALALVGNVRESGVVVGESFRQLKRFLKSEAVAKERTEILGLTTKDTKQRMLKVLADAWLPLLRGQIAVTEGAPGRYVFMGGKPASIPERSGRVTHRPVALLGLTVQERGGGMQARQGSIVQYIPLELRWIIESYADEVEYATVYRWDEKRLSALAEVTTLLEGVVLQRHEIPAADADPEEAACLLAAYLSGAVRTFLGDDAVSLVARIRCLAHAFPERGYPLFTDDDWQLLFQDLAYGKSAVREIDAAMVVTAIEAYAGALCTGELARMVPLALTLPSGRRGLIRYPENAPPELRARIADFIGWRGPFTVCQGRVVGVFDILAPNWRTTQKTADLDGFWSGSYLEIKKELKRRYPRHPWP